VHILVDSPAGAKNNGTLEVAVMGRIKQKIFLALVLSSVIPLLILTYAVHGQLLPLLDPTADRATIIGFRALILFTAFLIAAGSYMVWDVVRAMSRLAQLVTSAQPGPELPARRDEIGTVTSSFSRMRGTIERQTAEINSLATRLDAAYEELEAAKARLREFSFRDEVTGLYNRRFFSLRLAEEISRYRRFNHPVSVVLLDLDGFKDINDELGHATGDETLRDVGRLLLSHSRGVNVITRYGGDEFAVLLVETAKVGARRYADRIRQAASTYPFAHGRRVTASFGVASLPEDGAASTEDLVRAADEALYAAKRAGKNRVVSFERRST